MDHDHDISDHEIREALGALQCIHKHGVRPDLDDLLAIAYAQRRRDHEESGWQRKLMADDLGSELARMTGIDPNRCSSAAHEVLVGSRARLVIDTIIELARRLKAQKQRRRRRKGAA